MLVFEGRGGGGVNVAGGWEQKHRRNGEGEEDDVLIMGTETEEHPGDVISFLVKHSKNARKQHRSHDHCSASDRRRLYFELS